MNCISAVNYSLSLYIYMAAICDVLKRRILIDLEQEVVSLVESATSQIPRDEATGLIGK